jgi:hypothetical protein
MNVIQLGPDGKTVDEELAEWFERKRMERKKMKKTTFGVGLNHLASRS